MLKKARENYVEAASKMKSCLVKEGITDIENMDANKLEAIQVALRFMDASNDLIAEQTKALENMDSKLDQLLNQKKKESK